MIINLLDNTQSASISIIITQLNINNIDNISHTITINESKTTNSSPIINSKVTILDNPLPVIAIIS